MIEIRYRPSYRVGTERLSFTSSEEEEDEKEAVGCLCRYVCSFYNSHLVCHIMLDTQNERVSHGCWCTGDVTFVAHNHCNWSMHLFAVWKCSQRSDKSTLTQKINALLLWSVIFPFCDTHSQSISSFKNELFAPNIHTNSRPLVVWQRSLVYNSKVCTTHYCSVLALTSQPRGIRCWPKHSTTSKGLLSPVPHSHTHARNLTQGLSVPWCLSVRAMTTEQGDSGCFIF